jgi:hypothetical protein
MPITPWRVRIFQLAPGFLREGTGERLLYMMGLMEDCHFERAVQGVMASMPRSTIANHLAPMDALRVIASDNGIVPGLTEGRLSLATRDQQALDSWQFAGLPRGIMMQLLGYVLASTPMVRTVATRYSRTAALVATRLDSSWDTYAAGADVSKAPVHTYALAGGAGDWDWDSLSPVTGSYGWWQGYVVMYATAPNAWVGSAGTWGPGSRKWGAGQAWGVNQPASVGRALTQAICATFKPRNVWLRWLIVSFGSSLFDPTQTADGVHNPAGTFGRWSTISGGRRVPARFANARYFDGPA